MPSFHCSLPARLACAPGYRIPANSANIAPCGSSPWTIQRSPGTCIGPLMIWPPASLMRVDAASMEPEGPRRLRHFRHYAAALLVGGFERLIESHRAHIHRFVLGPAEQTGIEIEGARPVPGV